MALARARENWRKLGRSEKWITQRMTGQETRNKLTDYWSANEVKQGQEFAILTNLIHEEWSGVSVQAHKDLKSLKAQNLRDHMTEAELIFTALAELSTRRWPRQSKQRECQPIGRPRGRAAGSQSAPESSWKRRPARKLYPTRIIFPPRVLGGRSTRSKSWLSSARAWPPEPLQ